MKNLLTYLKNAKGSIFRERKKKSREDYEKLYSFLF